MASGLTDHVWSICELLRYKVVPSPWVEPKRRGRPKKQAEQAVIPTKRQSFRPRFRPRKGVLCSTPVSVALPNDLVAQYIEVNSSIFLSQFTLVVRQTNSILLYRRLGGLPLPTRPTPPVWKGEYLPC